MTGWWSVSAWQPVVEDYARGIHMRSPHCHGPLQPLEDGCTLLLLLLTAQHCYRSHSLFRPEMPIDLNAMTGLGEKPTNYERYVLQYWLKVCSASAWPTGKNMCSLIWEKSLRIHISDGELVCQWINRSPISKFELAQAIILNNEWPNAFGSWVVTAFMKDCYYQRTHTSIIISLWRESTIVLPRTVTVTQYLSSMLLFSVSLHLQFHTLFHDYLSIFCFVKYRFHYLCEFVRSYELFAVHLSYIDSFLIIHYYKRRNMQCIRCKCIWDFVMLGIAWYHWEYLDENNAVRILLIHTTHTYWLVN